MITGGRATVVTDVPVTNHTLLQTDSFQKLEQWEDLLLGSVFILALTSSSVFSHPDLSQL